MRVRQPVYQTNHEPDGRVQGGLLPDAVLVTALGLVVVADWSVGRIRTAAPAVAPATAPAIGAAVIEAFAASAAAAAALSDGATNLRPAYSGASARRDEVKPVLPEEAWLSSLSAAFLSLERLAGCPREELLE